MTEIRTASELDALPVGSVVLDDKTRSWQRRAHSPAPWCFGNRWEAGDAVIEHAPLTVLFRPDAPQLATGDDAVERAVVLGQAYNDLTGDGWGPERVDDVLGRVWDAALAEAARR